jgi:hypothetical protein
VHLAVIARANDEIVLAELIEKERPCQKRYKGNLLLVKLVELVDPSDRIVRFGFAMGEIYHGGVAESGIVLGSSQLGYGPWIVAGQDDTGDGCKAAYGKPQRKHDGNQTLGRSKARGQEHNQRAQGQGGAKHEPAHPQRMNDQKGGIQCSKQERENDDGQPLHYDHG